MDTILNIVWLAFVILAFVWAFMQLVRSVFNVPLVPSQVTVNQGSIAHGMIVVAKWFYAKVRKVFGAKPLAARPTMIIRFFEEEESK